MFRLWTIQFNQAKDLQQMQTTHDTHDGRPDENGRAIHPGEGYRLLAEGEVIRKGDDYYNGSWIPASSSVEDTWNETDFWPMRRKLPDKQIRLYTTCDDLGVINGAIVYATEREVASDNVREIKVDPSTGTLYVG